MYRSPHKSNKAQASDIEQWTKKVTGFSSQYGSETEKEFTAGQLVGGTSMYPKYGNFNEPYVFRTYGLCSKKEHWRSIEPFSSMPGNGFKSTDYVDCKFGNKVYPKEVRIFEPCNPGAVVRILAAEEHSFQSNVVNRWFELWKGPPMLPGLVGKHARVFSPPLNKCPFKTNWIRLEICSDLLGYYAALDAVCLFRGKLKSEDQSIFNADHSKSSHVTNGLEDQLSNLHVEEGSDHERPTGPEHSIGLTNLPYEVILQIFTFLDLKSLLSVGQTCKRLATLSSDSQLYKKVDLQMYWPIVSKHALTCLSPRLHSVVVLNMSWCGSYGFINEKAFGSFVSNLSRLRILKLFSCSFMTTNCLQSITKHCPKLEELDVGSCTNIKEFDAIATLTSLRRLNLYRTTITDGSLTFITSSCPGITHLNIGSCVKITQINATATQIGPNLRSLRAVDLWRESQLTIEGLQGLLSHCTESIEGLELGWCPRLVPFGAQFNELLMKCVNLRKLFLTGNSASDDTLSALGNLCPNLEQLDLSGGYSLITVAGVESMLEKSSKLTFLDISFCSNIQRVHVQKWQNFFVQCTFKRNDSPYLV